MTPRYAQAFAQALLAEPAETISIRGFDPPLVGTPGIRPTMRLQYNDEDFQLLGRDHEYTFSMVGSSVELSVQFYLNETDYWRLFAYCKTGMLFSVNLTLARDGSDVIPLRQKLKSATRGATVEDRNEDMEALAGHLRSLGLRVSEDRSVDFGDFDAKRGVFLRTTAGEFIRNFVTAALIKGHYMGNKGYELPAMAAQRPTRAFVVDPKFTSSALNVGQTYSRAELKSLFNITDATINNGIFHAKPARSVWLFVTEEKTPDRTPYEDLLQGDVLRMQGQTEGKTDGLIVDHVSRGLELLLFYRKSKKEHPHGAFVYEGLFEYVSHEGGRPTGFTLQRMRTPQPAPGDAGLFDPNNLTDERERAASTVVRRPGQAAFRDVLLRVYKGRCAVTGCDFSETLEAAHITGYSGASTDVVQNGLLLRVDLHRLFDRGHLALEPRTMTVRVSAALRGTVYEELEGRKIALPDDPRSHPSREALDQHRKKWGL